MRCSTCASVMKPLFTGFFCPLDCDRPKPAESPVQLALGADVVTFVDDNGIEWWVEHALGVTPAALPWNGWWSNSQPGKPPFDWRGFLVNHRYEFMLSNGEPGWPATKRECSNPPVPNVGCLVFRRKIAAPP